MLERDTFTALCIAVPPLLGLGYAALEHALLSRIQLKPHSDMSRPLADTECVDDAETIKKMKTVSDAIARGANAFLFKEYQWLSVYIAVFAVLLATMVSMATSVSFVVGAVTSIVCGYVGMKVAVYANVRTAHQAWRNLAPAFATALRAGSILGFCLVSMGILVLFVLIECLSSFAFDTPLHLFEAITGYGLGGSSIALFARVGGGIYTKAADVGADLSGKNDQGIDEDDPRNPACIADNVGDNVGDVAGMGADLFGSLAESTCAALVVAAASPDAAFTSNYAAMLFPLTLSSLGIVGGMITLWLVRVCFPVNEIRQIEPALKMVLVISTVIMAPVAWIACDHFLPAQFTLSAQITDLTPAHAAIPIQMGLWSGLAIGFITEYYTSHSYSPVREVAATQKTSAATGIISGLALGYMSTVIPSICLGVTVVVSFSCAGMYGVALAALGMLGTLTMGLAIDVYGPIADNAGGIAEMSGMGPQVRARTDALDAAGNTTAAIGKGFAIGSAALVSLALFGAFCVRAQVDFVNVLDPWTFAGLLLGAMLPYAFSAMTMKSVGEAAVEMVEECKRQFPGIMNGTMQPDYERCISISTASALREMVAPGLLVILSPLAMGILFGKNGTAGLLAGILVSGIQMAVSAANSGGAWDNSKKYIEAGGIPGHPKGSETHKNAVTGDTVGDPLKDTSGPSLNILVKLSAITSLVFAEVIAQTFSNSQGGPVWVKVKGA